MSTIVIAEPGCTHEGSYAAMVRLLETAAQCGANVWKPQFCSDPALMCERRHIGRDHPKRAYYEKAYSWLQFPIGWHADFREHCHRLGMKYAVTAYLPADVFTLEPYVDILKIASFEARDIAIRTACKYAKVPMLVSTGMEADLDDLRNDWRGINADFLHCVSSYPAPLSDMNLQVLRGEYLQGLSDHSRNLSTGAVAVACGAKFIETHYRLDDCDPNNPDFVVAFSPAEFAQYIRNVRDAELMLGSGKKELQPCEQDMAKYRVMS